MATRVLQKDFFRHRTVNDLSTLKRIGDEELANLVNFDYVPAADGAVHLEMRGGTSKDTMSSNLTSGTTMQGIHVAEFTGGTETIFAFANNLWKLAATPTSLVGALTDAMFDFDLMNDKLIMVNGTDVPKKYTFGGSVANLGGSPPTGKYVHVWHNYCFMSGISANKNRLQYCVLGNEEDWTTTSPAGTASGSQDFDYGEITGISSLGDTFYIFFKNKIQTLTGYATDEFVFSEFADIGCISHYGIVSDGTTLYFPARDGIYAIGQLASTDRSVGGISLVKLSSERIRTYWDSLDLSTLGYIHGVHDPDGHKVRWSVRRLNQSYNDREIFFDYDQRVLGFGFTEGRYISCYSLGTDTNGNYKVVYGDSRTDANGGMVYAMDTSGTDDGTAISGTIETKAYDFDRPDLEKSWLTVNILAKGTGSETPVDVFYGVGEFPSYGNKKTFTTQALPVWGTFIWGVDSWSSGSFENYPVAIRKMGESLSLKFLSDTSSKKIQIAGWSINAQLINKKFKTAI